MGWKTLKMSGSSYAVSGNASYAGYVTPTDVYVIINANGNTKSLMVHRVLITTAATAAIATDMVVTIRTGLYSSTANNLGSRIVRLNSPNQPTTIAQVYEITATPVTPGSTVGFVSVRKQQWGIVGGAGMVPNVYEFGGYDMGPLVLAPNDVLAFSHNGAAWPAGGLMNFEAIWTEV